MREKNLSLWFTVLASCSQVRAIFCARNNTSKLCAITVTGRARVSRQHYCTFATVTTSYSKAINIPWRNYPRTVSLPHATTVAHNQRFGKPSQCNDLNELCKPYIPPTTKRNNSWETGVFGSWIAERNANANNIGETFTTDLLETQYPTPIIDRALATFMIEAWRLMANTTWGTHWRLPYRGIKFSLVLIFVWLTKTPLE